MIAKSWRKTATVLASVVAAALFVPVSASAIDPRFDPNLTVAFGNVKPGDPGCEIYPTAECLSVYPNSEPYGDGYSPGQVYVVGRVVGFTPDPADGLLKVYVDVTVSDGTTSVSRTVTVNERTLVGMTYPADQPGYFHAELSVTEMGLHVATAVNDRGASPLIVTFRGRNAVASLSSETATLPSGNYPSPITLTKYATTGNDAKKPTLSRTTFPPAQWCHTSSRGASFSPFGGSHNGGCGSFSTGPSGPFPGGALPDLTWLFCTEAVSEPHRTADAVYEAFVRPRAPLPSFCDPFFGFGCLRDFGNPFRSQYCPAGYNATLPSGHALVSGQADDSNPAGGVSEIADVLVQMLRGADSSGNGGTVLKEYRSFIRTGPRGEWGVPMNINDFEPNWPDAPASNRVKVTVTDAVGNVSVSVSGPITIYPY